MTVVAAALITSHEFVTPRQFANLGKPCKVALQSEDGTKPIRASNTDSFVEELSQFRRNLSYQCLQQVVLLEEDMWECTQYKLREKRMVL